MSCAFDIGRLSYFALKSEVFREIVETKSHDCVFWDEHGSQKSLRWENTNKLLGRQSWRGVKTGITLKAGPCLSCADDKYIIVLLNSRSMEDRWDEAQILRNYVHSHY